MAKGLTVRQEKILQYLESYIDDVGYPPSIREIGKKFTIASLRGVTVHLDALERKGFIERQHTPRSIRVVKPLREAATPTIMLPICGTIAAGHPIPANQDIEEYIPVHQNFVKGVDNAFLLRVTGDSMVGDGIMPRDLVIVKPQPIANSGDIIAAMIDGEATVKRIIMKGSTTTLMPSNPTYQPIDFKREGARIIGKVIGLLRDYTGHAF